MDILTVNNLRKTFNGNDVIKDLSFSIKEKQIFGFLGKNGAGKTTTMKIILGFLKADFGEILVFDEKVHFGNTKTNRFIGYLPDVPEFYDYMTSKEYLNLCGEITGLSNSEIKERTEEMLNLVGLKDENKRIGKFSRGMKQRLGIAQALFNKPKLLICDEPTSALDPIGRKEILDILLKIKEHTTVLFSTHILQDVERVCDEFLILNEGVNCLNGNISDIKNMGFKDKISVEFFNIEDRDLFLSKFETNNIKVEFNYCSVIFSSFENLKYIENRIFKTVLDNNLLIGSYNIIKPSLEDLFIEVIK